MNNQRMIAYLYVADAFSLCQKDIDRLQRYTHHLIFHFLLRWTRQKITAILQSIFAVLLVDGVVAFHERVWVQEFIFFVRDVKDECLSECDERLQLQNNHVRNHARNHT